MCRDADKLFTGSVNDVEDGSVTIGRWELFDEIKRDRVPWTWRNRELLNKSEWLVSRVLVSLAGNTTVNKILNISMHIRPSIVLSE